MSKEDWGDRDAEDATVYDAPEDSTLHRALIENQELRNKLQASIRDAELLSAEKGQLKEELAASEQARVASEELFRRVMGRSCDEFLELFPGIRK